jgi:hypothetical protein
MTPWKSLHGQFQFHMSDETMVAGRS